MMRKLLVTLWLAALLLPAMLVPSAVPVAAGSPSALIDIGNGAGDPGATGMVVPVSLASLDGAQVASLQFEVAFDSKRLSVGNVTRGSAADAAGKSADWSIPSTGNVRVVIYGGATVIEDGPVALISFSVLGNAAPGSSDLSLLNTLVSDPSAQPVAHGTDNGTFIVNAPPATNTPTSTYTPTPTRTPTRTPTQTLTPGPSLTPSKTHTPGGATATRTPTITPTLPGGFTATITPIGAVPPTPIGGGTAASPSATPAEKSAADLAATATAAVLQTAQAQGEIANSLEGAIRSTATALAELDAAVAGTATALAPPPPPARPPTVLDEALGFFNENGDLLLLAGVGIAATILVGALIFRVWRRKPPTANRAEIDKRLSDTVPGLRKNPWD
jgi:hypothetical protein